MNAKELIDSGIIELYVMGIAGDDECVLVETLAQEDDIVRHEIASVNDALIAYSATNVSPVLPAGLKNKILGFIESSHSKLPPRLTAESTANEWLQYLEEQQINPPENFHGIYFLELPGTEDYYTYAVWGKNGDYVDEEFHPLHHEYLFVCNGECEMTINGKKSEHRGGDFIEIAPGVPHSARVLGKELMLVIGQRRAA
ncbi:MAG TPA: cupin domain-containing protein [Chitinophagales bacterium]|nr:cupin domain-containing protein [Chitinophagales bacterium]